MFDNFMTEMAGELRIFVIIAICAGLGATGYFIRTGIDRKRKLNEIKSNLTKNGQIPNSKWDELASDANRRIWIPIGLWIAFFMFIGLGSPNAFPGILWILIFPVLGFFGVVIFPDD